MSSKEPCCICGSVRKRSQMVLLKSGKLAHMFHKGVEGETFINEDQKEPLPQGEYIAQVVSPGEHVIIEGEFKGQIIYEQKA
jgi:hypothetical protein